MTSRILVALVAVIALTPLRAAADGTAPFTVAARIPLGAPSGGEIVTDGTSIVAARLENGEQLVRIDPRTNRIASKLRLGPVTDSYHFDVHFGFGFGSAWATMTGAPLDIVRINPTYTAVVKRYRASTAFGAVPAFGSVWAPEFFAYEVARIDPRNGRIVKRFAVEGPTSLVAADGAIWVLAHRATELVKIDPASNKIVVHIPLETHNAAVERMTYGNGALWISDNGIGGGIVRVDPATAKEVAYIPLPSPTSGPLYVATGGGYVWAATDNGYVVRIDPSTNRVAGSVLVNRDPQFDCGPKGFGPGCTSGVVYAFGSVWVDTGKTGTIARLDTG
jgi:streptogramin lyase